jgi:RND superfamily putative drug exporter
VITAAATVMIAVFISFAVGDQRALQLFGVSMAAAVLLDAFIIRSILLPAVLVLAGDLTWRFPNGLGRRLPRLALELPTHAGGPINEPATVADFDPR